MLANKSNEDRRTTMDVGLFDVHFFQGIEEKDVGGRAIVYKNLLDSTIGY